MSSYDVTCPWHTGHTQRKSWEPGSPWDAPRLSPPTHPTPFIWACSVPNSVQDAKAMTTAITHTEVLVRVSLHRTYRF